MLASVPVEDIKEQVTHLLRATRTVSMGRDREPVEEPDNQVRLRMVELLLGHGAGAPGSRKPVEPVKADKPDDAAPGKLVAGK